MFANVHKTLSHQSSNQTPPHLAPPSLTRVLQRYREETQCFASVQRTNPAKALVQMMEKEKDDEPFRFSTPPPSSYTSSSGTPHIERIYPDHHVSPNKIDFEELARQEADDPTWELDNTNRSVRVSLYGQMMPSLKKDFVKANKSGVCCYHKCKMMDKRFNSENTSLNFTIDHDLSVAKHFNSEGYKQSYEDRHKWLNWIPNWVPMHRICNSSKGSGGHTFDIGRIEQCLKKFGR